MVNCRADMLCSQAELEQKDVFYAGKLDYYSYIEVFPAQIFFNTVPSQQKRFLISDK